MKIHNLIFTLLFLNVMLVAQQDSIEVFIIDAFVTPEKPHTFKLSFFTDEEVKTSININDKYLIDISDEYLTDHSAEIDFSNYKSSKKFIPYNIILEKTNGDKVESETFELILPYEKFIETKEGDNPISTILVGMILYFIPSPNFVFVEKENYFSLTKELPIITFYSSGYNYPMGNISLEYTHIYEESINNFLRLGYKHIIPLDYIEYVSPGITGFTDFNGFNGIGGEVSVGLFTIYDVFTLYSRYRYNVKPSQTENYFHEISIGLFSHFFTIDF